MGKVEVSKEQYKRRIIEVVNLNNDIEWLVAVYSFIMSYQLVEIEEEQA